MPQHMSEAPSDRDDGDYPEYPDCVVSQNQWLILPIKSVTFRKLIKYESPILTRVKSQSRVLTTVPWNKRVARIVVIRHRWDYDV